MRLTYFGHSAFLVEAADGTRIVIDPYCPGCYGGAFRYRAIDQAADVLVASHTHDDHWGADTVPGKPIELIHPTERTVGGVKISGVKVAHDEEGGGKRGENTIIVIDDGDVRLVHLGDLGHTLDAAAVKAVGRVDVLLIPVGGFFTIDHKAAAKVVDSLDPRIVVPMHFKTDKVDFPITDAEPFLATQKDVKRAHASTLEVTRSSLPPQRSVVLLDHTN